jgi:hypothetical protein
MPRLSVFFVRSALVHLSVGLTLGALLLWHKALPLHPQIWRLLPMHMELLLVGWVLQLALGVAYWILPRWRTHRGPPQPVWVAWALLNLGVLLVSAAALLRGDAASLAATTGRAFELAAAVAFAAHAWPRVKPWDEGQATGRPL